MYISGTIGTFDHRNHQFGATIQELELYEDEAKAYTGIWVSGKELERHQKIFCKAANSALYPNGTFVHYQFFTGIDYF